MLTMLALLAVSTMTLSLTSCNDDDDKDNKNVSLYKQWKATAAEAAMPEFMQYTYSDVCFDFSQKGKFYIYCKMKIDKGVYKKGKWYTYDERTITVTPETETTGTIEETGLPLIPLSSKKDISHVTYKYELTKNTLTLYNFVEEPITLKVTSGIKSEGYLEDH